MHHSNGRWLSESRESTNPSHNSHKVRTSHIGLNDPRLRVLPLEQDQTSRPNRHESTTASSSNTIPTGLRTSPAFASIFCKYCRQTGHSSTECGKAPPDPRHIRQESRQAGYLDTPSKSSMEATAPNAPSTPQSCRFFFPFITLHTYNKPVSFGTRRSKSESGASKLNHNKRASEKLSPDIGPKPSKLQKLEPTSTTQLIPPKDPFLRCDSIPGKAVAFREIVYRDTDQQNPLSVSPQSYVSFRPWTIPMLIADVAVPCYIILNLYESPTPYTSPSPSPLADTPGPTYAFSRGEAPQSPSPIALESTTTSFQTNLRTHHVLRQTAIATSSRQARLSPLPPTLPRPPPLSMVSTSRMVSSPRTIPESSPQPTPTLPRLSPPGFPPLPRLALQSTLPPMSQHQDHTEIMVTPQLSRDLAEIKTHCEDVIRIIDRFSLLD